MKIKISIAILVLCSLGGCFRKAPPPIIELSKAHEKFIEITQEDIGITPQLTEAANTLWIYVPVTHSIIDIKSSGQKSSMSNKATERLSLKYADAYFEDDHFYIEYDIAPDKKYDKNFGYISTYTDAYQSKQRALLYNIQRAYSEVGNESAETPATPIAQAPDFFVLVIADIQNGIEAKTTLYYPDIQKILSPVIQLPAEEANTRYLVDIRGDNAIINDTTGKHLAYSAMTLPEFLAGQINNRITFQYTRSSFPPSKNTVENLLSATAKTLALYQFTDFEGIRLHDLNTDVIKNFTAADLEEFTQEPQAQKSQFHIIQFNGNQERDE